MTAAAAGARPAAVMVLPGTEGEEMASLRRPARHVAGLLSEQPWLAIAWDWSRGSRGGGVLTSTSIAGPGPQPWERRKGFEVDWPVVERPLMA